ncbi:MAG: 3-phosphoserine/phosphohydroxythreonine transaminase [Chloroflexota bacterium]|nr:3-phosphoserine/phosphohydroxythreonine transaminase [Chloroflexota bacterium]
MNRVYNFSPGPATLPLPVLEQVKEELLDYRGKGMSVLEMSHRSKEYGEINAAAEARCKRLLGVDEGYRVLFMQGGASTQFALVPLNFLSDRSVGDYVLTGNWSLKALKEAKGIGQVHVAASSEEEGFRRIPHQTEMVLSDGAAYVHITSNNTIYGTQFHAWPEVGDRPLVADMSSDIMSRPFDAEKFALVYAGAQKNIGPAGVTVVLLRESWLDKVVRSLPTMFQYKTFVEKDSLYNTPPVFAVYIVNLVLKWIEETGGLEMMEQRNQQKASYVYDAIDRSDAFYRGYAASNSRSLMNITFNLPDEELSKRFIQEAAEQGLVGLKGYRTMGGIRASTYNAMPVEGCRLLAEVMDDFVARNG